MPVAPVRWNFWNSGRPALPAPITCPAFASMIWLMSRCRVADVARLPGESSRQLRLHREVERVDVSALRLVGQRPRADVAAAPG